MKGSARLVALADLALAVAFGVALAVAINVFLSWLS